MTSFAEEHLKIFIERIERIEEEKKALTTDIAEVYAEAKDNGLDTKIMKKVVKLRAMDAAEREEEATLIDIYLSALGMTPIEAAIADRKLRDAVNDMGTPVPLTEEERQKGAVAAFVDRDGTRVSIASGEGRSKPAPAHAAEAQ